MIKRTTGIYEKIGSINFFIPYPLPPHDPVFIMDEELNHLHESAMKHLKQLDDIAKRLPNEKRFIKAYIISIHSTSHKCFVEHSGRTEWR